MDTTELQKWFLQRVEDASGKPVLVQCDPKFSGHATIRIARDNQPAHLFQYKKEHEAVLPYSRERQQNNGGFFLRDSICEKAVMDLVRSYLSFCKAMEIVPPIWMFSSLLDCKGVHVLTDRRFRDVSQDSIDRSPAFIPELEITALDAKVDSFLQTWCDYLWQAAGQERSLNYDKDGKWHEPQ